MAASNTMINDFVGLPIIISDWDALTASKTPSSAGPNESTAEQDRSQQRQLSTSSTSTTASSSSTTPEQHWTTGFSDFADGVWARMTQGMKKKLRDAAIGVLKQTDDSDEGVEKMTWMYADDARFLD